MIEAHMPANAQVRALVHECVHALGIDYSHYPKDQAEVIADTATFVVCAGAGLAVDSDSLPYVVGWSKDGALTAVTELAQTIDRLVRRIEDDALNA